ncbi:DNA-processing protein DprA [Hyphobacterium sp. HN65]|uniref:DNA-processing protein DprA n=1 Tax=Hyphobacterium lacteum TaxID=3116575 RepID=A0ABU7LSJ1_9PROT|nr:DNA-processing protein DprA [Hyphobacterium sp. HN65]MEE2526304.1 DNA-processing protein DprA [Hyphobacterium sp. HN65]
MEAGDVGIDQGCVIAPCEPVARFRRKQRWYCHSSPAEPVAEVRVFSLADVDVVQATLVAPGWEARMENYLHQEKYSLELSDYKPGQILLDRPIHASGGLPAWPETVIALAGSRSPTAASFGFAWEFGRALAERGAAVCAGGMPGIDLAAHLGAFDVEGGVSLCALANPVEMASAGLPHEIRMLDRMICQRGLFLSEQVEPVPVNSDAFRKRLQQRNRVVTGLSAALVIFECSPSSATIDMARRAPIQGKRVFAHSGGTPMRNGTGDAIRSGLAEAIPANMAPEEAAIWLLSRLGRD